MSQNTQKYVWAMAQTPQKYNIWAYRVPWSCQTGLGQIGFWWVDCGEPKYVLIFAITDNTVQRAAQLFIVLVKSKM